MTEFHQAAAAVYLAAGIAALLGIVMPSSRLSRGAIGALVLGAVLQGTGNPRRRRSPISGAWGRSSPGWP